MSDLAPGLLRHAEGADAADVPAGATPLMPTAGQLLKQARLRSGLTLEELAARVKVTVARLQSLEDDRTEAWPNVNVLRAAAATVCRHVQLDPAMILDRLPKAEKIQLTVAGPEAKVGIRDRNGFTLRHGAGTGRLPALLVGAALLLLAALVYFGSTLLTWTDHVLEREAPSAVPSVAGAVTDPVLPPDAEPTDTRVGVAAVESAAAKPVASVPVAAAPLASVAVRSAPAASSAAGSATVQEPLVVIKAKGLTWIAVSDARGVTLLRKTLSAGETASASGALPLWVVVGRADNADVSVRGEAVTLEPSVPDNVARFKVQ